MKKVISFVLTVGLAVAISGSAFGSDKATPKEAEAMVKKAVAFLKANGKEKAFAEFNRHQGKFTHKDLYITACDMKGNCLAHGLNVKLVGKNLIELKDADGKFFFKERLEVAKSQGKGWQDYKFTNPLTKKVEEKTTYFERYEDVVVAGGAYKK